MKKYNIDVVIETIKLINEHRRRPVTIKEISMLIFLIDYNYIREIGISLFFDRFVKSDIGFIPLLTYDLLQHINSGIPTLFKNKELVMKEHLSIKNGIIKRRLPPREDVLSSMARAVIEDISLKFQEYSEEDLSQFHRDMKLYQYINTTFVKFRYIVPSEMREYVVSLEHNIDEFNEMFID